MSDKRGSPRRRVLKAGSIEFGGLTIACMVRNISETGAALRVESFVGIPDEFTLLIVSDRLRKRCKIVWRTEKQIGVMFA